MATVYEKPFDHSNRGASATLRASSRMLSWQGDKDVVQSERGQSRGMADTSRSESRALTRRSNSAASKSGTFGRKEAHKKMFTSLTRIISLSHSHAQLQDTRPGMCVCVCVCLKTRGLVCVCVCLFVCLNV